LTAAGRGPLISDLGAVGDARRRVRRRAQPVHPGALRALLPCPELAAERPELVSAR